MDIKIDLDELFKKAPSSTNNIIGLYERLERINKTYLTIRRIKESQRKKPKYVLSSRSL